jgi:hypothetical protein
MYGVFKDTCVKYHDVKIKTRESVKELFFDTVSKRNKDFTLEKAEEYARFYEFSIEQITSEAQRCRPENLKYDLKNLINCFNSHEIAEEDISDDILSSYIKNKDDHESLSRKALDVFAELDESIRLRAIHDYILLDCVDDVDMTIKTIVRRYMIVNMYYE